MTSSVDVLELCCFEWSQNLFLYDISQNILKMKGFSMESDVF